MRRSLLVGGLLLILVLTLTPTTATAAPTGEYLWVGATKMTVLEQFGVTASEQFTQVRYNQAKGGTYAISKAQNTGGYCYGSHFPYEWQIDYCYGYFTDNAPSEVYKKGQGKYEHIPSAVKYTLRAEYWGKNMNSAGWYSAAWSYKCTLVAGTLPPAWRTKCEGTRRDPVSEYISGGG